MIQTIKQTVKQILQAGQYDAWDAVVHAFMTKLPMIPFGLPLQFQVPTWL